VRPFRIGLVGAGRMGRTHLRALAGSGQVAVTAIAETSAAARSAVSAPGVTLHESVADMLDHAALDGVLIAAPTDQHGAIIAEVAARGLPILCEKPCGLTAAAARASARAAVAAGVPLQVAYWRRFVPGLRQLHDRMAAGELGVIHLVTCYQWDERPPSPVFRAHSGGIAIDMGVHEFDQLRWLTGQDIEVLAAVASGSAPEGIADVDGAQVIVRLSGGATGFISLGRYYPVGDAVWAEAFGTRGHEVARAAVRRPCDFTIEVNGSSGTLMFSYARLNELWYGSGADDAGLYGMRRIRAEHPSHPYAAQWWPIGQGVGYGASFANQTADLLEGWPDAPWTPGFREGAAVQAVCEAMETSAATGRWVSVGEVIASTL
jgi:myo-inositol 2-dehydrogenase / D-chiro-inositol 1-dehydrogenase